MLGQTSFLLLLGGVSCGGPQRDRPLRLFPRPGLLRVWRTLGIRSQVGPVSASLCESLCSASPGSAGDCSAAAAAGVGSLMQAQLLRQQEGKVLTRGPSGVAGTTIRN